MRPAVVRMASRSTSPSPRPARPATRTQRSTRPSTTAPSPTTRSPARPPEVGGEVATPASRSRRTAPVGTARASRRAQRRAHGVPDPLGDAAALVGQVAHGGPRQRHGAAGRRRGRGGPAPGRPPARKRRRSSVPAVQQTPRAAPSWSGVGVDDHHRRARRSRTAGDRARRRCPSSSASIDTWTRAPRWSTMAAAW